MKRKISIIFYFVAIISAIFMISILVFHYFFKPISYKDQLLFGASTIALISLNIHNYLEKSEVSFLLICSWLIIACAFILSLYP